MKIIIYVITLLITIEVFSDCNFPKFTMYGYVNINGYDSLVPVHTSSTSYINRWKKMMEEGNTSPKSIKNQSAIIRSMLKGYKERLEKRNNIPYNIVKLEGAETRYMKGWNKPHHGCSEIAVAKLMKHARPWEYDSSIIDKTINYDGLWMEKAGLNMKGAFVSLDNYTKELHLAPFRLSNVTSFAITEDRYEIYPRSYYNRLKKEEEERIKLEKDELRRKEAEEKRERDFRKYRSTDGTKSFVGKIRGINLSTKEVKFEEENTKNIFIISIDDIFEDDVDYIKKWYRSTAS